jgi:hypothetical protein
MRFIVKILTRSTANVAAIPCRYTGGGFAQTVGVVRIHGSALLAGAFSFAPGQLMNAL